MIDARIITLKVGPAPTKDFSVHEDMLREHSKFFRSVGTTTDGVRVVRASSSCLKIAPKLLQHMSFGCFAQSHRNQYRRRISPWTMESISCWLGVTLLSWPCTTTRLLIALPGDLLLTCTMSLHWIPGYLKRSSSPMPSSWPTWYMLSCRTGQQGRTSRRTTLGGACGTSKSIVGNSCGQLGPATDL